MVVLLIVNIVFFGMIRTDPKMKVFDQTRLYSYEKQFIDLDKLQYFIETNTSNNWIDLDKPEVHCGNMLMYDWPSVRYTMEGLNGTLSYLPGNPSCPVEYQWNKDVEGIMGNVGITSVTLPKPYLCKPGVYNISLYIPPQAVCSVRPDLPSMRITIGLDMSVTFSSVGKGLASGCSSVQGEEWKACKNKRENLAMGLLKEVDCEHENSQMCSCVNIFVNPLRNKSFVLADDKQRSVRPSKILYEGISKCIMLRRGRDKYTEFSSSDHKQGQMLFIVVMCVFLNMCYDVYLFEFKKGSFYYRIGMFALLTTVAIICNFISGIGDKYAWVEVLPTQIVMMLLGLYYEIFYIGSSVPEDFHKPTMHPAFFGMVYAALSSYVLVEEGVIDVQALSIEGIKSFAATWVYTKIIVYYTDVIRGNSWILVDRAQMISIFVLGCLALDATFTPYLEGVQYSFVLLLPFFWFLICISEGVWMKYLNIGYGDMDKNLEKYFDIRRNVVYTLIHLIIFWVTSHFFTSYMQFVDVHRDRFNYPAPTDNKFLMRNGYMLPGYIKEL